MSYDGTLKFDTSLDSSGLEKDTKSLGSVAKTALGVFSGNIMTKALESVVSLGRELFSVKNAIASFAEFEQLSGGVSKLFGTAGKTVEEYAAYVGKTVDEVQADYDRLAGAEEEVFNHAADAYKTAGLNANAYMSTVTSFSAALISGLDGDTAAAAALADQAITDMADNANTFGTAMGDIQNAYQGFAKQNYTMLDNLKLGYGGTQTEMIRLINDAGILNEEISSLDGISFDQIIQAIHEVQTQQGIAGTTAHEASTTISGSVASMQAAWDNLVAGLADDNADISGLIDDLIESMLGTMDESGEMVGGVINNIMPRVAQALTGLGEMVAGLAPVIAQELPGLVAGVVPALVQAGVDMVLTLVQGMADNVESVVGTAVLLVTTLQDGLIRALPVLIPAAAQIVVGIVTALTEPDNIMLLINGAIDLILALTDGLIQALPVLIAAAPEIISSLCSALVEAAPQLLEAGAELIFSIQDGINQYMSRIVQKGADLINKFKQGVSQRIASLRTQGHEIIETIKSGVMETIRDALTWGRDLIENFKQGISDRIGSLKEKASEAAQSVKDVLGFSEPKDGPLSNFHTYAPDMMMLYAKGIRENKGLVIDEIMGLASEMQGAVLAANGDIAVNASGSAGFRALGQSGTVVNYDNRVEQTNNYNVPVASPSSVAKSQREAVRNLVGGQHA